MMWIHFKAPFGAFRMMMAGSYRSSYPCITPSAAYGLVLNLASIDIRRHRPPMKVAIGLLERPSVSTFFQHLHSYLIGNSGRHLQQRCKGQKFWISPGRREVLANVNFVVGVEAEEPVERQILAGLDGDLPRFGGLPFAGDNSFIFERIEVLDEAPTAQWYVPLDEGGTAYRGTQSLPVRVHHTDPARTRYQVFCPLPPGKPRDTVWVDVA